jgi:hypothetical protein
MDVPILPTPPTPYKCYRHNKDFAYLECGISLVRARMLARKFGPDRSVWHGSGTQTGWVLDPRVLRPQARNVSVENPLCETRVVRIGGGRLGCKNT